MLKRAQIVSDMTVLYGKSRALAMTKHLDESGRGKLTFGAYNLEFLALDSLSLDDNYQRGGHNRRKNKLGSYDAEASVFPLVAKREGSKPTLFYTIDGWHRIMSYKSMGIKFCPCLVIPESTTQKREADLFYKINGCQTAVNGFDKFKSGFTAGHDVPTFVVKTIRDAKLTTKFDDTPNADFTNFQALVRIVSVNGPDHFVRFIRIISQAYVQKRNAPHLQYCARCDTFVRALSSFLLTPVGSQDDREVIRVLRTVTAEEVKERADVQKKTYCGRNQHSAIVKELVKLFDVKKKKKAS